MATGSDYRLGSIWLVSFDPSIGTEIRKTCPAVIISGTVFNQRSKVTVLPISSTNPSDRLRPVGASQLGTKYKYLRKKRSKIAIN